MASHHYERERPARGAAYLDADGSGLHQAWSINVFGLRGDRIAEITSFIGAEHFAAFGLPSHLPDEC